MITITIMDLIQNTKIPQIDHDFVLYVFRKENEVLYVGQSRNIFDRLRTHLSVTGTNWTNVGALWRENLPMSLQWEIDLYTLHDLEEAALVELRERYYQNIDASLSMMEAHLIKTLGPSLNVVQPPRDEKLEYFKDSIKKQRPSQEVFIEIASSLGVNVYPPPKNRKGRYIRSGDIAILSDGRVIGDNATSLARDLGGGAMNGVSYIAPLISILAELAKRNQLHKELADQWFGN